MAYKDTLHGLRSTVTNTNCRVKRSASVWALVVLQLEPYTAGSGLLFFFGGGWGVGGSYSERVLRKKIPV